MVSGLSFKSAFVFSINSLILPGFPLTSFHLTEANLFPRAILKNQKPIQLPSSYSKKMRQGQSLVSFSWLYILV